MKAYEWCINSSMHYWYFPFFLTMYVILLTPRRVASFFERFSPFTHTTFLSVPPLSTVVNRFLVLFSGPDLVATPLESAWDEQSWFARTISGATSVSCLTSETSVPGIEPETCSQSFDHHTKALPLSFWTYSFRWVPNQQGPEKILRKNPLVLAGIRTRAV